MIILDKKINAEFFFKREPELDSDGNAVYALFSDPINRDYGESKDYVKNIYIHIPTNEDIDNLYFSIENKSESDNLYFELDAPLNLYLETVKGSSVVMDLKSKLEIDEELKLYVKDFFSDLCLNKNYIGFYDDEKKPNHNCDNKLYCDRLAIRDVENSSILFKRGNYNKSDKPLKDFSWQFVSNSNYKVGGTFSFIRIASDFKQMRESDDKNFFVLKFDNLSERKATSLNIDNISVDIENNSIKEIEISAPSISLRDTTIKASYSSNLKERAIRDSYGITVSDVALDINGVLNSYSQAGIYAKSVKNNISSNTIYIKGDVDSQVKGGSLNLEGSVALNQSKIDCGGPLVINNSKLVGATLVDSSRSEILIEESRIRGAKVKELSFYDDKETKKPDTDFYLSYINHKLIRYASIEYIELIGATLKYDNKAKNPDDYLLTIDGNILDDYGKVENSFFDLSSQKPIKITFKGLDESLPKSDWLKDKEKEPTSVKNCSFLGGNEIIVCGPVDFSNAIFKDTEAVIRHINAIKNSELTGKNSLTLIEEPISNTVLSNVDLTNVSGISDNYVKNIKAKNIKYDGKINKEDQSIGSTQAEKDLELL